MISDLILKLQEKTDLTYDEMNNIMTDVFLEKQMILKICRISYLVYLKKEKLMMNYLECLIKCNEYSLKIEPKNTGTVIDMCGTGGDKLQTFNVSTTASFVVAAAGGMVAKHGNRSSSGVSGSADIFEYFGYDLNLVSAAIADILEKHNICFMFAQKFHPAMKHVVKCR